MIKTIKITSKDVIGIKNGSPAIQPAGAGSKPPVAGGAIIKGSSQVTPPDKIPPQVQPEVLGIKEDKIEKSEDPNSYTQLIEKDPNVLTPSFSPTPFPNIMAPSYAVEDATIPDKKESPFVETSSTFDPIEQLVGVSLDRPEIVMLTNFLPLFTHNDSSQSSTSKLQDEASTQMYMTDAGKFVDTHMQAKLLRISNVYDLVKKLIQIPGALEEYIKRYEGFEKMLDTATTDSGFVLSIVRSLQELKDKLDLFDYAHNVSAYSAYQKYQLGSTNINQFVHTTTTDLINRELGTNYAFSSILQRYGFTSAAIQKFTSSKVWIQVNAELKNVLKNHSSDLVDFDAVAAKNDENPLTITKPNTPVFSFARASGNLLTLQEISSLHPGTVPDVISTISNTWRFLYQNASFKSTEANIVALAHLISKEYRYSKGLASKETVDTLASLGYTVSEFNNSNLFDSVVGRYGTNALDFPAVQTNTLISLAQRIVPGNAGVLTFESKYVSEASSVISPGSSYYVDQVTKTDGTKFDTTRLTEFVATFEDINKKFASVVTNLNLLSSKFTEYVEGERAQYSSIVSNSTTFLKDILSEFVRIDGNNVTGEVLPEIESDPLCSLYALAANNNDLKVALLLRSLLRISRKYHTTIPFFDSGSGKDNTATATVIDEYIITLLDKIVPIIPLSKIESGFTGGYYQGITKDSITTTLKQGTYVSKAVERIMEKVLYTFLEDAGAVSSNRTRYNGHLDTTIAMATFDLLTQIISTYSKQKLSCANYGTTAATKGILTYNVARFTVNNSQSVRTVIARSDAEIALVARTILGTFSVIQKLAGGFKEYANYLDSAVAKKSLSNIASVINDQSLLPLLFSEQQASMSAAVFADYAACLKSDKNVLLDQDDDKDYDGNDFVKMLDGAVPIGKLKSAFYGMFATDEYSSVRGYNKKILSVGLPIGISTKLRQRITAGGEFDKKQNDLVSVVVYKIDSLFEDVVFKPKKFTFELSRFPVRNASLFLKLPDAPTFDQVISSIPTRDFGQSLASNGISYYGKETNSLDPNVGLSFDDETYSFLSDQQKLELAKNHTVSYMLECYIRALTSLSVAEYHFEAQQAPPENVGPASSMIQQFSSLLAKNTNVAKQNSAKAPSTPVVFAGAKLAPQSIVSYSPSIAVNTPLQPTNVSLAGISTRQSNVLIQGVTTIGNASRMITPLTDPGHVARSLFRPKKFDRVFNVIVDPDEFEIDREKTESTEQGRRSLGQMIASGLVNETVSVGLSTPKSFSKLSSKTTKISLKSRDKSQGDVALDKYFVTVESYGEDVV